MKTVVAQRAFLDGVRSLGIDLFLLIVSALCFSLSFPSFLSTQGWGILAYISIVPAFIVVHRTGWVSSFLLGWFYGLVSYAIFNYWLAIFHPLAIFIVPLIYSAYFFVLFPLLKAADRLFPKYAYLVQILLWMGYEFLRTKGFLGYPYGNLGYSQYLFYPLIQISSVTGMWGVSVLVIFPSAYLGNAFKTLKPEDALRFFREHRIDAVVWIILMVLAIAGGAFIMDDYHEEPKWRVALIQQNEDPWKNSIEAYQSALNALILLSDKALEEDPEIVIWSETAFVPRIEWHNRYRTSRPHYELVRDLLYYLEGQDVPFVAGNDHAENSAAPGEPLVPADYNAAILFKRGEITEIYRKTHLVPFTEHFPYENILPGMHRMLVEADTHFWEKGTEYTVFTAAGVRFSTPICFEDVFGYLSREFVRQGAQVIVNMTNDSWSGSVAAEMQHAGMAVFRAVENRRSVVRSTNGGITCVIDPDGRITDQLEPFTADYLIADVPVHDRRTTVYTRFGDWFAWLMLLGGIITLLYGFFRQTRH
ncbi:apolipoprotein N-acyltransferase [Marispirochaeta sp.]|jgi:apolipoprotein N-acyltransferase|uniref:apolipoprotein N-acyltransferase n=1 Tax=Marispirochaeta sp. TaxID=2038653 RepID=UPI0029C88164|nr:apolipoprotein N-acyltransferase [Marispirochaeta sp.]